ncbi:MAG: cytochrome c biogenesis protein CcsA [Deltaproteobacteria bacterium]|nr:cytochrome c biogenesis protein CcsA [Deltaproteobacteria bacterium]
MAVLLHQLAAVLYLVATLGTALGLALPDARLARLAVWVLAIGALVHLVGFVGLHWLDPPPALTTLAAAVSWMAWLGVVFALVLLRRGRLESLAGLTAPFAFAATLYAAAGLPGVTPASPPGAGGWPHLHVILASAGLSLLGVAGVAGVLFLVGNRQLKAKRGGSLLRSLPSLEALDRVNVVALALGFPLLTLGVVAGMIWTHALTGHTWDGSAHALWTAIGWAVYLGLVLARFAMGWRGREAAVAATAGFAFLFFAVIGVEAIL